VNIDFDKAGPHPEFIEALFFIKVGDEWKLGLGDEDDPDDQPKGAEAKAIAAKVRVMAAWDAAIERLAKDIEQGRYKTVAEVRKVVDAEAEKATAAMQAAENGEENAPAAPKPAPADRPKR
jgi:hypothetical protein